MRRIPIGGMGFDPLTGAEVAVRVRRSLDRGVGGWIVTPNVDIVRQVIADPAQRSALAGADLVVADGAPLIWASRLAGTPLPERVAGADLIWTLAAALAADRRSIFVLGGDPASPGRTSGAHRAAAALAFSCPGVRVAGHASPRYGFDAHPGELAAVCADVIEARPDLVYVGLGFPRQERLILRMRADLPGAWFLGCGAAVSFAAGDRVRAADWLGRAGLEWLHRLAHEPRRLAGRYLRDDLPQAVRLLGSAVAARRRHRRWRAPALRD
ncbi:MAG TPA: WecB/TagA/CpsF family glycosyltransferase [Micromonosporaceae bacterium]|nr:WecB/TagA/CpsF family glycosyltransferase [Micromonosporaceae bacterium]